jgi:hypothetical protein
MLDSDYPARFDNTISMLPIDLADVDWLYIAQLYALTFFSVLIVTLVLMFWATLLFWRHYPDDLTL